MSLPPKLRDWNLNTLILGFGLVVMFVGWGMAWADARADIERNSELIAEVRARVAEIDESNQRFANLDYRVSAEEKATASITATLRDLERSFSSMGADIRVMRDAIERLTASDRRQPP